MEVPQLRQAKRSLKVRRSATPGGSCPAPFAPLTPPFSRPESVALGLAGASLREHVDLDHAAGEPGGGLDRLR